MKFVNKVKITIQFGKELKEKIVLYANETQLTGDETDFTLIGKFLNKDKNDGKDS